MSAPAVDSPTEVRDSVRDLLIGIVEERGSVDLGEAVDLLGEVPVHIAARAVTDALSEGILELTEDQELRLRVA